MAVKGWKQGNVVVLEFPNGDKIYGLFLKKPLVKFFEEYEEQSGELKKAIFEILIFTEVKRYMKSIGFHKLNEEDQKERRYYKVDTITKKISIYINGIELPAEINEIRNMECLAIWNIEHIEERYKSMRNGVKSKYLMSIEQGIFG